jgi:hypothetical protein
VGCRIVEQVVLREDREVKWLSNLRGNLALFKLESK